MDLPRSALYGCLADALMDPPEWLALPGRDWPLYDAALALSNRSPAARLAVAALGQIEEEPLEVRRERYERICLGVDRNGIAWYESGAIQGRLLTEETFAVARWYEQAGLKIAGAEMADHAGLELAFLAYLTRHLPEDQSRIEAAFLQQHAGRWLPWLGRTLAATGDAVYGPVGALLADWLQEVCCQLGVPGFRAPAKKSTRTTPNRRLAAIQDKDACTLCSFCVHTCPRNALTIRENERYTSLMLLPDRCSGCGRCERICPSGALVMEESTADSSSTEAEYLLRQSERAVCRACGSPLVSRAELAYIAACLGRQDWLDYCLDCRMDIQQSAYPS